MDLIAAHVAHMARLGRRPRSVYVRQCALRRFEAAIRPKELIVADIEDFRAFVMRPSLGLAAQRAECNHLRGFYRWLVIEELRVDDPTIRLERPKVPALLPRPMPDELVIHVLANAPERVAPWFHLAAYAGLRACEIGPLRGEDIVGDTLIVRAGKGGAEGIVPVAAPLLPILAALPKHGWLFPHRGPGEPGPTTAMQVSKVSNKWLHAQGIEHRYSLHSLRHWFGTKAYQARGDIRMAQRLLRHASVSTTQLYAAIDDRDASATVALLPDLTGTPPPCEVDELDVEDDAGDYEGLVAGLVDRTSTVLNLASAYIDRPALDTSPLERELLVEALCGVERALDALEGGY